MYHHKTLDKVSEIHITTSEGHTHDMRSVPSVLHRKE